MATFKQDDWTTSSPEEKSYAFSQVGRTMGTIFVDMTGFKPTLTVEQPEE
jgi:hypothetical protein